MKNRKPIAKGGKMQKKMNPRRCAFDAMYDALNCVWNDWKDSQNAKSKEAEGYYTLRKVKSALKKADKCRRA